MNYRHAFHAGNFADVFKHVILARLLTALARKDKGFAYIDTHAGPGRYDLGASAARNTGEYRHGIGRLWREPLQDLTENYLAAVRALNRGDELRYYPGSPRIARFLFRPQDRMRLAERAPAECARLQAEFAGDAQVTVQGGDGYALLKAWLPPPERRGLVLIDPPYERDDEWALARGALSFGAARWPQGVYALWYPIKTGAPLARFKSAMAASGLRKLLVAELTVWPADTPFRLNGCGMVILNPPWRLDAELRKLLDPLALRLTHGSTGGARVEWLVPE